MLSKNFFRMMITVLAAVTSYYLLSSKTPLPEGLCMTAGVAAAIVCSVALKKRSKNKQR